MCKYFESFHEYNGCRLREAQANGQPTGFASFLRGFTRAGVEGQDGQEPQHHQIKEKNIMQCEQCITDPRFRNIPSEKRVCDNPEHIDGEAARAVVESIGYTVKVGTCPVCAAVKAVIEKESNPTVIVSHFHIEYQGLSVNSWKAGFRKESSSCCKPSASSWTETSKNIIP
jgi:hypothetical protein